jgi:hypothetical protein
MALLTTLACLPPLLTTPHHSLLACYGRYGPQPSDSNDFWDSERCKKAAFDADWHTTTGAVALHASKDGKARAFGTTKCTAHQLRCASRDRTRELSMLAAALLTCCSRAAM